MAKLELKRQTDTDGRPTRIVETLINGVECDVPQFKAACALQAVRAQERMSVAICEIADALGDLRRAVGRNEDAIMSVVDEIKKLRDDLKALGSEGIAGAMDEQIDRVGRAVARMLGGV